MIDTNTRTPKNQEIGHLLICVYFINLMSFKIEISFLKQIYSFQETLVGTMAGSNDSPNSNLAVVKSFENLCNLCYTCWQKLPHTPHQIRKQSGGTAIAFIDPVKMFYLHIKSSFASTLK